MFKEQHIYKGIIPQKTQCFHRRTATSTDGSTFSTYTGGTNTRHWQDIENTNQNGERGKTRGKTNPIIT